MMSFNFKYLSYFATILNNKYPTQKLLRLYLISTYHEKKPIDTGTLQNAHQVLLVLMFGR